MRDELERFRSETRAVFADVEKLVDGLSDEQARTRPAVGEWSIAECLDHLTLTVRAYEPVIEDVSGGRVTAGRQQLQTGVAVAKVRGVDGAAGETEVQDGGPFVPAGAHGEWKKSRRDFFAAHQWVLDKLEALDTLDLGRIKVESPFAKWMRYPLGLVFYILPAHCRRHLWQAENVKASMVSAART